VVVGSANYTSPTVTRLERLAARREAFRWLGHVNDRELLVDLWLHCDVYLHGHSVGGTNPALLQALGTGAPTLAFDAPFNREGMGSDEALFGHNSEVLAEFILSSLLPSNPSWDGRKVVSSPRNGPTSWASTRRPDIGEKSVEGER
jgi:hypothetical protein